MVSGAWGAWKTVATWSTAKTRVIFLPPGTHQFQAQAQDLAGNLSLWKAGVSLALSQQQEASTAIKYSTGWSVPASLSGSYGGKVKYTTTKYATATYTFTGRNFAWVSQKSSNRGKAEVYEVRTDGSKVKLYTVDLYSGTASSAQLVYAKAWTTSATRTIEVRVLGTKNLNSSGTRVDVDAFVAIK